MLLKNTWGGLADERARSTQCSASEASKCLVGTWAELRPLGKGSLESGDLYSGAVSGQWARDIDKGSFPRRYLIQPIVMQNYGVHSETGSTVISILLSTRYSVRRSTRGLRMRCQPALC
jgi:hypothetical protein